MMLTLLISLFSRKVSWKHRESFFEISIFPYQISKLTELFNQILYLLLFEKLIMLLREVFAEMSLQVIPSFFSGMGLYQ